MTPGRVIAMVLLMSVCAAPVGAAVFLVETFDLDPNWVDRDLNELAIMYDGTFGNGGGSLRGVFAAQDPYSFESDAFRVNGTSDPGDGGSLYWTGDYYSQFAGFNSGQNFFTFDLYSADVLPSVLTLRFNDGANTFSYSATLQLSGTGSWNPVSVPLYWTSGWVGSASQFSNAFTSVAWIDVQLARNGAGNQTYYLDNFALENNAGQGGGNGVVPEPSFIGMATIGVGICYTFLRGRRRRRPEVPAPLLVEVLPRDDAGESQESMPSGDLYHTRLPD